MRLSDRSIWKKDKAQLVAIFLFAFLIKLPLLRTLWTDPAFALPIIDSKEHNFLAYLTLNVGWIWPTPTNHTQGYPFFLALIYKIFGYHVVAVAVIQYLMGAIGTVLIYLLAKRIFNRASAWIAVVLMSGYWYFAFIQSYVFSESLALFLNVAMMAALVFLRDSWKKYLLAGTLFALSVLTRPDILLFGLFVLGWFYAQKWPVAQSARYYGLFILPVVALITPIMVHNQRTSRSLVLRTQIGANFYLGNSLKYRGTNIYLERGKQWEEFIALPLLAQEVRHPLTEAEQNRFFVRETWNTIRRHPGQWGLLILSKLHAYLTGRDYMRSEDVYFWNHHIRHTVFRFVRTKWIFILALVGLACSLKRRSRDLVLIYLFLLSALFLVFFAYKTRYILPVVPFFILFAGYGVFRLYRMVREKDWRQGGVALAAILLLSWSHHWNPFHIVPPDESEALFAIASTLKDAYQYQAALPYFQRALRQDPENISAYNELAMTYYAMGDYGEALSTLEIALSLDEGYYLTTQNYDRVFATMQRGYPLPTPPTRIRKLVDHYLTLFKYPLGEEKDLIDK